MAVGFVPAVLFLCFSFLHVATDSYLSDASEVGFSVELIHPDSPDSPFHDPASTPFSSLHTAIHRSAARRTTSLKSNINYKSRRLLDASFKISALVTRFHYYVILKFYIGTPPSPIFAILDTGSDLSWVLCNPCKKSYKHSGRKFNPNNSSTYKIQKCLSDSCNLLEHHPCDHDSPCKYNHAYADDSFVEGHLSTETLWFDSPDSRDKVRVPEFLFGCTHHTEGKFSSVTVGLVGLSGSNLSLIRQLGPAIGNKFSYCLPSKVRKSARMDFGTRAIISSPGAVSTPFHLSNPYSFYNLILESISIVGPMGKTYTINLEQKIMRHRNHMMIDTGTYVTFIDSRAMGDLSKEVLNIIPHRRVDVPKLLANNVDLCFDWKNPTEKPKFTFVFEGDAKVHLADPFMLVDEKTMCLAIASNIHNDDESVFGSSAQKNYRIGFDLDAERITFLPEDC